MSEAAGSPFAALAAELEACFASDRSDLADDDGFGELALRCFRLQYDCNPLYRAYCDGRGATPEALTRWQDVPPVPTSAFKHVELMVDGVGPAEAVFRTSGTTSAPERRGRHFVPRLSLYRASLLPGFRANLVPEGEKLPFLSLIPSPSVAPGSSLSFMVGAAAEELAEGVTWCTDERGRPDFRKFHSGARSLAEEGRPVLVLGTAFAFVGLLDHLEQQGAELGLPVGSRLMETGGFKGRSRAVNRKALHGGLEVRLGLGPHRIVNEYGMTELLTQLYEPVLQFGPDGVGVHRAAPWLRVRALHPESLAEQPPDEEGLLAFYDLANLGSACHVLTEDVGSVTPEGVRLRGRAVGAEPRGCSLALEDMLRAGVDG